MVLSSDLQKPSTTLTPSLKPATLSPSPLPGPPPSPSPTPDDSSEEGLVTIIPGVDLPDSSPAVATEAGPKADGAAAAAAATAAAAAAVAAVNSTGVIDSVNVTALPVAAEVPVTSAPRATEQQQQQHQDATQLVLGYQGGCDMLGGGDKGYRGAVRCFGLLGFCVGNRVEKAGWTGCQADGIVWGAMCMLMSQNHQDRVGFPRQGDLCSVHLTPSCGGGGQIAS